MDKRYLFIHNPISGGNKHHFLKEFELVKHHFANFKLITTTHQGHARELAAQFKNDYDVIIAVGGDGTINEIAASLVHSNTALGIIPNGSANGLAHYLGIPISVSKAAKRLQNSTTKHIDVITANNRIFVNVAGVGFDGHVNILFNRTKFRGLWSYAKLVFTEYVKYKEFDYTLLVDDKEYKGLSFFIAFANTTQYGHNFHIAPNALAEDGILQIIVLRKPPFILLPYLIYLIFKGKIAKSKYYREIKGSKVTLHYPQRAYHLDGEIPENLDINKLDFNVLEGALKVIY